jgi:hypothetical protein
MPAASPRKGLTEFGLNLLLSGAVGLGIFLLYTVTNQLLDQRPGVSFGTFLDGGIPFMPWMILVYVLGYPVIFFPALVIRDRKLLWRVLSGFIICAVVALPFYFWLPVRVARPGIPTQESFFYWSLALQYILDKPGNSFPGLYLMQILLTVLCCFPLSPRLGWWSAAAATAIAFASLALRQHFFADLVAAGLIASMVFFFWVRPPLRAALDSKTENIRYPAGYALRYVLFCGALVTLAVLLFKAGLRFSPVLPVN